MIAVAGTMIAVVGTMIAVVGTMIGVAGTMIGVAGTMIGVAGTMIAAAGMMIVEPNHLATTAMSDRVTMTAPAAIDSAVAEDVIARPHLVASMIAGRGGTTRGTEARRVGGMMTVRGGLETGTGMGPLASNTTLKDSLGRADGHD